MKQLFGNYLGLCINNNDPEKRGRVQVFIPHLMPAMYENWNELGEDVKLVCLGDNLPDSLPPDVLDKLIKILPWAESASPILGTSSPGNLITQAAGAIGAAVGAIGNFFNQSPVPEPISTTSIGNEAALLNEAKKYAGGGTLGTKVRNNLNGTRGTGACARGTVAVVGAMTGNSRFTQGSAGGNASDFGTNGNLSFASSGIYNQKQSLPPNYINDPSQWRVGDIVASGGGSKGYGHIQVWTGNQWVSDFQQGNRILQGSYNGFALHRMNAQGEAALQARGSLFGGFGGEQPQAQEGVENTSASSGPAATTPHQDPNPVGDPEASPTQWGNIANPEVQTTGISLSGDATGVATETSTGSGLYSDNFVNFIKSKEGYYEKPYWDYKQWTVGYGTKASGPNDVVNRDEAERRLRVELNQAASQTNSALSSRGISLTQSQKEALYSFTYNGGVGMTNSLLDSNGGRKNWNDISQAMALYNKAGGKTLQGLVNRRNAEIEYGNSNGARGFEALPEGVTPSTTDMTGTGSMVNRTDNNGPTAVLNLNNMAKGVFTYPAAGALLWVFFREGNPLFPVYFAANYGAAEWSSAYRTSSPAPGYQPTPVDESLITSTGGMMNLNGVGGLRWEDTNSPLDRTQDTKSIMLFGHDGSNIYLRDGYNQYFSKFDRRDQVEGDRFETTLGFKEDWVQGDSNEVIMGDSFVKIGNVSPPCVDAVERIQQIIGEIMQPLAESNSGGGGSSDSSAQNNAPAANRNSSFNLDELKQQFNQTGTPSRAGEAAPQRQRNSSFNASTTTPSRAGEAAPQRRRNSSLSNINPKNYNTGGGRYNARKTTS